MSPEARSSSGPVQGLRSSVGYLRRTGQGLRPRAGSLAQRLSLRLDSGPAGSATETDVVTAYRLLLGREPDPTGLASYRRRLADGTLRRDELAAELLGSPEFARRSRGLIGPADATEAIDVDGFVITVDPGDWAVGATIAAVHRYEPDVTAVIRGLLGSGGTFVDIGANIGWFSLLAASIVGPTGAVLAVEPNLRNCELLTASCARNGFTQIDVVAAAASDSGGWLALETDASNGRVVPLGAVTAHTEPVRCSYAVPAFTLDELLQARGLDTVDAIKVDVEGVEARVFAGAEHLLAERHPPIVFEWYPVALRSTGGVEPEVPLALLRQHGYAISVIGYPTAEAEDSGPGLSDGEIEAVRVGAGRENLDLLARYRA